MSGQIPVTFVVPTCGDDDVIETNFLASPVLRVLHGHEILVQEDYTSAAEAYNAAIDRASNDLLIFTHNDMIFPESWLSQLEHALTYLGATDPNWGVLGCCGADHQGLMRGWVYAPNQGLLGGQFDHPELVQTLDEIVLIFRRSSGLRFYTGLPGFHLYGTDICLRAAQMGMKSYAVPAFCVHNANYCPVLPSDFYKSYRQIRELWKNALPVYTSCQEITKMQLPMFKRRVQETLCQYVKRNAFVAPRATNIAELLKQADSCRRTT